MLYYSQDSKVLHEGYCACRKRIRPDRLRTLPYAPPPDIDGNRVGGFRVCHCCGRLGMNWKKAQKEIQTFLAEHDYVAVWRGDMIAVRSEFDDWLLVCNVPDNRIRLYHKNSRERNYGRSSMIAGYHDQNVSGVKVMKLLRYIESHDRYIAENGRSREKKWIAAHKREKRRKKQELLLQSTESPSAFQPVLLLPEPEASAGQAPSLCKEEERPKTKEKSRRKVEMREKPFCRKPSPQQDFLNDYEEWEDEMVEQFKYTRVRNY